MHNSYKEILAAQLALDKTTYQHSSSSTRDALGVPLIYHQRTPDLIYTRFKDQISLRVSKFIGIKETTEIVSFSTMICCMLVLNTKWLTTPITSDLKLLAFRF